MGNEKRSIIVIDDDKSILRTFTRLFQKNGYEVDTAETGKEAVEKLTERSFDVALIDIRLPDMDGVDLLPRMRNSLSCAVKILITGLASLESGTRALEQGADAYLVKPVKPDDLLSLIEEKLRDKDLQKDRQVKKS